MTQYSGTIVSIFHRAHRCLPLFFVVGVLFSCALVFLEQDSSEPLCAQPASIVDLKVDESNTIPAEAGDVQNDAELQLVGLLPTFSASSPDTNAPVVNSSSSQAEQNLYWEFTVEESTEVAAEVLTDENSDLVAETEADSIEGGNANSSYEPIAILLAPQAIPTAEAEMETSSAELVTSVPGADLELDFPSDSNSEIQPQGGSALTDMPAASEVASDAIGPEFIDEERQLVALILRESTDSSTGNLTNSRVNQLAISKIAEANVLADRGATFAARQRLIEVLRMVSQSKDAAQGKPEYSQALRAGLRALEEAEDFSPRGSQLEAELNIELVVDAHQTPVAQQLDLDNELPRQMLERYLRYAQIKLAMSVAGDPAGSMALYALGKVTSRMGKSEKLANPLAHQQAVAFQQAAVLSRGDNYFATHELAVLLAESGHLDQSHKLLARLANSHQNPTLFRNLARVQEQLGMPEQAAATRAMAIALSSRHPQQASRVRWVAPQNFGQSATPAHHPSPGKMVLKPTHDRRTAHAPVGRNAMRTPQQQPTQQWR